MRKMVAALGGLCVGIVVAVAAQGNSVINQVDRVHEQMMEATRKQDTGAWAAVVTDDVLVVPPDGRLVDKAHRIDQIKAGEGLGAGAAGLTAIRTRADYKVRIYGDAAIVSWVNPADGSNPGTAALKGSRVVRVFVKQNGAWRLAHSQQTAIR